MQCIQCIDQSCCEDIQPDIMFPATMATGTPPFRAEKDSADLAAWHAGSFEEYVATSIRSIFPRQYAWVMRADADMERLVLVASTHTFHPHRRARPVSIAIGEGASGLAYLTGTAVVVPNYEKWPHHLPVPADVRSVAAYPLLGDDGQPVGIVACCSAQPRVPATICRVLDIYAQRLSLTMARTRFQDVLECERIKWSHQKRELQAELNAARGSLSRLDQMDAAWRYTAGVVHDIRHLCMHIECRMERLRAKPDPETVDVETTYALKVIADIRGIVRQIVSLRGDTSTERVAAGCDLAAAVRDSLQVLHAGIPCHITLDCRIADSPVHVALAPSQASQILMNLVTNAADAVGSRPGQIAVTVDIDDTGRNAVLSVADSGPGIPPEKRHQVMDYYYTTKSTGTGLGLAVIDRLVRESQGTLAIGESAFGGAKITVRLPLIAPLEVEAPETILDAADVPEPNASHSMRVLYVDDDKLLASLFAEVLETNGCDVTALSDARAALDAIVGGGYDLVITDQCMPGIKGIELLSHLRERDCTTAAMLLTGYANNELLKQAEDLHVEVRLKPCSPIAIAKDAVRTMQEREKPHLNQPEV